MYKEKADIICLTETWLSKNKEPQFKNYNCEWLHRQDRQHGGIAIIIRDNLCYRKVDLTPYNDGALEAQSIILQLKDGRELKILNFYNPSQNITLSEIQHYIHQMGNTYILVGDLNAHSHILMTDDSTNTTGKNLELLLSKHNVCLINPLNLVSYTDRRTGKGSCLDLCLSSPNIADCCSIEHAPDVGSDHCPLLMELKLTPDRQGIGSVPRWKVDGVNWDKWRSDIQDSTLILPNASCNILHDFEERINYVSTKYI